MTRLHHLALGARDVGLLAGFYRDVLGLPERSRHRHPDGSLRSVWLDLGGALLMVEQTAAPARRVDGVGAGPFLVAVAVPSDERAVVESRLAHAGCPVEQHTRFTSYARDPEGNRVAVSCYPIDEPT